MARPREFDEEKVLDAAADAFWINGYEATSTRDLAACTGLTASSIYAAFGDKRNLFRRALDHYLGILRERMTRLESTESPAWAITGFFDEIIERSLSDRLQRGCMLVNSALESSPRDPAFRADITRDLTMIEDFFRRCIIGGQQAGEIPPTLPADDTAAQLLSLMVGIRVFARVRPDRVLMTGAVRQTLTTLGLPWPPKPANARHTLRPSTVPAAKITKPKTTEHKSTGAKSTVPKSAEPKSTRQKR